MEQTKRIEKQKAKITTLKAQADDMLRQRDLAPAMSNEWHNLNAGWNKLMDRYHNATMRLRELTIQNY